jgi:hypothetical protein
MHNLRHGQISNIEPRTVEQELNHTSPLFFFRLKQFSLEVETRNKHGRHILWYHTSVSQPTSSLLVPNYNSEHIRFIRLYRGSVESDAGNHSQAHHDIKCIATLKQARPDPFRAKIFTSAASSKLLCRAGHCFTCHSKVHIPTVLDGRYQTNQTKNRLTPRYCQSHPE